MIRSPDDAKADRALRRVDVPKAHFILEAEAAALAGAVDVEALLVAVCGALGVEVALIHAALVTAPVRIKCMPPNDLESVALALGTTTGLSGGCRTVGLFLPPRTILVPRLDWKGLLGHELTHLVRHILGGEPDEHEAGRVGDQVG